MTPYEILGIEPTATKVEIKKAFAKLVKENPPDKDANKYQEIRNAYEQAIENLSKALEDEQFLFVQPETADAAQTESFTSSEQSAPSSDDEAFDSVLNSIKNNNNQNDQYKIDSIKTNLFKQNTLTIKDLLKKYPLRGITLTRDESRIYKDLRKTERKNNPSSTISVIRLLYKIAIFIVLLIILANSR